MVIQQLAEAAMGVSTKVKCSTIRDVLKQQSVDQVWQSWLAQVRIFGDTWKRAVCEWGPLVKLAAKKIEKHLQVIDKAFDLMDDWRFERIKFVNARHDEIENAISFIRNTALRREVSSLRLAPVMRNLAGVLRSCLIVSVHDYGDDQVPTVCAQSIFAMAFVRTLFPLDEDLFVDYLPEGASIHAVGGELDNYHVMLQRGCAELGIEEQLRLVYDVAAEIWTGFDTPLPLQIPDEVWKEHGDGASARMHFQAIRDFHSSE